MKTIYHAYNIDTSTPDGKAEWSALETFLLAQGLREFHAIGDHCNRKIDGCEIELETSHLFKNQWNTAPIDGISEKGLRVFDWARDSIWVNGRENKTIKRGHYLEQTAEMREIRRNTVKCLYCGAQEAAAKGYVFCPHCIGSEYLTEKDLKLTRMVPVCDLHRDDIYKELTEAEAAHLLPLFKEAQIHGHTERDKKRIAKQRETLAREYEIIRIARATTERDGFLWLMDHGIKTDNVIFYSHTGRFGFGWRKPLGETVLGDLLNLITEFPFSYDIKTADGRTLSGER